MNIQSYFKISKALMNSTMKILPHGSVQVSFKMFYTKSPYVKISMADHKYFII